MAVPDEVTVWVGLDVGKEEHFADVLDDNGNSLFARPVRNDEADLEALLDRAAGHGVAGLVIDQPGSIAQLAIAVAGRRQVPVAYVPRLVMRRAADLYPGEAKTDRRDAFVLADTARTRRRQVHRLDTASDELLGQLRVLNGFDIDLAADVTRLTNRLRDALTSISPALERAVGPRVGHGGARDLLACYPTPTALRRAGRAEITNVLRARSPRSAAKVTDAVIAALDAQTVTLPAEAAVGRVISELATDLDRLHQRRAALAEEIEEVFLAHPFGQILVTLAGIGPRTGSRILAEIGDGAAPRTAPSSPATPASPPSPASPAPASKASPRAGAATTASRTPCSSPRSLPSATPSSRRSTSANALKARSTTPPSSASPAAAATHPRHAPHQQTYLTPAQREALRDEDRRTSATPEAA